MHHPQCVKSPDDNCVNCNPKCVNCEENEWSCSMVWECIGNRPVKWALGDNIGGKMVNCIAFINRLEDGRWQWTTRGINGYEPSRIEAMRAAEFMLNNRAIL